MKKIIVSLGERSYPIFIAEDTISQAGSIVKSLVTSGKIIIISDSNVYTLFGASLSTSLINAGFQTQKIIVPSGENSKSLEVVSNIYKELAKNGIERSDSIVALGGGVIGDLAGYVAATYLRGLPFFQVPTTLLSQIDSSIGGKVGVNLEGWKNLVGSFYQPKAVLIDVSIIDGLPSQEKSNGLAEIIKTAFISGEYLVAFLEGKVDDLMNLDRVSLSLLIEECCRYKASIVEVDEKEDSLRRILNYGHTFGHAIESASNLRWTHGQSVAAGMMFASALAYYLGIDKGDTLRRQYAILKKANLPVNIPPLNEVDVIQALQRDKKISGGKFVFVLVSSPGKTRVIETEIRVIKHVFQNFKSIIDEVLGK